MYIVIGGDKGQIKYAKGEASANGEIFREFNDIVDFTEGKIKEDIENSHRITFRAHGSLSTYGGAQEEGIHGLTAEAFVDELIAKKLPKNQNLIIDLVGCNIGLVPPGGGESYVQKVNRLLKEKGYHLKVNAVTHDNTDRKIFSMSVYRPANSEYGQALPQSRVFSRNAYIQMLRNHHERQHYENMYQEMKSLYSNIVQSDSLNIILTWASNRDENERLLTKKMGELSSARKERGEYTDNKSKRARDLNVIIKKLDREINDLNTQLKEPSRRIYEAAQIERGESIEKMTEKNEILELQIEANKKNLKKLEDAFTEKMESLDYLKEREYFLGEIINVEPYTPPLLLSQVIEPHQDYMLDRAYDLKTDVMPSFRSQLEDLKTESKSIMNAAHPINVDEKLTDQRIILDSNAAFCVEDNRSHLGSKVEKRETSQPITSSRKKTKNAETKEEKDGRNPAPKRGGPEGATSTREESKSKRSRLKDKGDESDFDFEEASKHLLNANKQALLQEIKMASDKEEKVVNKLHPHNDFHAVAPKKFNCKDSIKVPTSSETKETEVEKDKDTSSVSRSFKS